MAALTALTLAVLSNCGAYGRGFGALDAAACPELGGNADALRAQYAANVRVNGKIRAFVQAAKDLGAVSLQIEAEAAEACQRMGLDLWNDRKRWHQERAGWTRERELRSAVGQDRRHVPRGNLGACHRHATTYCEVSAQASASCQGACDVESTQVRSPRCNPASFGLLPRSMRGSLRRPMQWRVQRNVLGERCQRKLRRRMLGDCTGACDASCHARCQGTWQAPKCEGYVRPPSADAECNASCRAHANVNASCTPAVVQVQVSQNAEMAARLAATLQANLPQLLHAELALGRRLMDDVRVVGEVGAQLPKNHRRAGAHALACVAARPTSPPERRCHSRQRSGECQRFGQGGRVGLVSARQTTFATRCRLLLVPLAPVNPTSTCFGMTGISAVV